MKSLPILFQDEHLIVVNKPAGLLVHRTAIDRHETAHAMQILRDQLGQWVYPIHRLDKPTSGALVFALDRESARRMTDVFFARSICKSYLAVVRGFTKETERIDYALREPSARMTGKQPDLEKPAQQAVTEYERLATVELPHPVGRYTTARYSLITAAPFTGRTHQIRRHLKHIFHPVIGDSTYGDGKHNVFYAEHLRCRRLLLHAREVAFTHPFSGQQIHIQAPLDSAFRDLLITLWGTTVLLSEVDSVR
jgi:tRNA pseudouridine65 synthase